MAIQKGRSASTPQATTTEWVVAFEADGNSDAMKEVELECDSTSPQPALCRINGEDNAVFRIAPGQIKDRHRYQGIEKIEFSSAVAGALVLWSEKAQPTG